MTLFIFSDRTLTRSGVKAISRRFCLGILVGLPLLSLALGVSIGRTWHRLESAAGSENPTDIHDVIAQDNRALAGHIGELSGRLIQLELEAESLASRIEVTKQYQERMRVSIKSQNDRTSRTESVAASGGPMLQPLSRAEDTRNPDMTLQDLKNEAARVSALLRRLDSFAVSVDQRHMSFPGRAPIADYLITSNFGTRSDPFFKRPAFHSGVDYSAPTGTFIFASAGGKIIHAGYRNDYGNTIEIDHGAGLVTRYAHASELLVSQGMTVMPGQKIARVGSSGRSTGAHLHFEILEQGRFIDPMLYLNRF